MLSADRGCAVDPDVSWSAAANRFLVAWSDGTSYGLVRAQLLDTA